MFRTLAAVNRGICPVEAFIETTVKPDTVSA